MSKGNQPPVPPPLVEDFAVAVKNKASAAFDMFAALKALVVGGVLMSMGTITLVTTMFGAHSGNNLFPIVAVFYGSGLCYCLKKGIRGIKAYRKGKDATEAAALAVTAASRHFPSGKAKRQDPFCVGKKP